MKPVELLLPPGLSFWQALQRGYAPKLTSPTYLKWVRTLPCAVTGEKPAEAHHLVGHGMRGEGDRTPDLLAFPLIQPLHRDAKTALHVLGHKVWESEHGSQLEFVAKTLIEAIYRGVLVMRSQR